MANPTEEDQEAFDYAYSAGYRAGYRRGWGDAQRVLDAAVVQLESGLERLTGEALCGVLEDAKYRPAVGE